MTGYDQEGKKQTQGGVQSIFTTDRRGDGNTTAAAVGLFAVAGGVSVWAWTVMNLNISNGPNISQSVASSALAFASLGMLTVLAGTSLCVYSFAKRRKNLGRNTAGFSLHSNSPDTGFTNESSDRDAPIRDDWDSTRDLKLTDPMSKTFVTVVAQSLVYVTFYGGLVAEYNDNPRMQAWVQTNLPLVGNLLNYYGVVLLSGLLGVLVVQFLHGKHSSA